MKNLTFLNPSPLLVPEIRRASHSIKWNKEAELPGYTYDHKR